MHALAFWGSLFLLICGFIYGPPLNILFYGSALGLTSYYTFTVLLPLFFFGSALGFISYYTFAVLLPLVLSAPQFLKSIYSIQCGPTLSFLLTLLDRNQFGVACNMGDDKVTVTVSNFTMSDGSRNKTVAAWCDSNVMGKLLWFRHEECHVQFIGRREFGEGVRFDVPKRWIPEIESIAMAIIFIAAILVLRKPVKRWAREFLGVNNLEQEMSEFAVAVTDLEEEKIRAAHWNQELRE